MRIYYWNIKKNFGDLLTPLLIKRFTRLPSEWSEPMDAELVMVGSILEHLPAGWDGIIAGAGKLHEKTKIKFPNARILALRGPLTAKGVRGDFVLADPGLLADELVKIEDKKYNLGIVPHWTDDKLEYDPRFQKYNPHIIRPTDDPLKAITQIAQCKKIISSSLHGIVLADAFGIPRRIEIAPRMLSHPYQEGGIFKWLDYSASLGIKFEPGVLKEVNRNTIQDKQFQLFDVMEQIKQIFR